MNSIPSDLLGLFIAPFDHGLLLIEDSESNATHDAWDAAQQYVHFDRDSLYVAVQSAVDGHVEVSAYRDEVSPEEVGHLIEVFSGMIELSSGILRVCDSDQKATLNIPVSRKGGRLRVLVDEPNWATKVVVMFAG
ncbi:hypothetical protein AB0J90_02825 [Micromonospora sp. NPDC049523]|uniref:hypothetical protein n=1 Tax=Micromonospora sp. NPDC049523 TaxID=3155921 RepID=UPI00341804B4